MGRMVILALLLMTPVTAEARVGDRIRKMMRTPQGTYSFVAENGVIVSGCCANGSRCWMMRAAQDVVDVGGTHVRINGVDHPITYRNTPLANIATAGVATAGIATKAVAAAAAAPFRMVQRTVTEMQRQKQCRNGVCYFVEVPITKTIWVKEMIPVVPAAPAAFVAPTAKKVVDVTYKFSPIPQEAVGYFVAHGNVKPGMKAYDLGCGDGRVLEALAGIGVESVGVEFNPKTVQLARHRVEKIPNARVVQGDMYEFDFSDADTIFLYHYPSSIRRLLPRLRNLRRGTRIVSYMHDIPDVCSRQHTVGEHVFFTWNVGEEIEPSGVAPIEAPAVEPASVPLWKQFTSL